MVTPRREKARADLSRVEYSLTRSTALGYPTGKVHFSRIIRHPLLVPGYQCVVVHFTRWIQGELKLRMKEKRVT
jgi:hypothetical protein